jgi:hypothetical protein
VPEPEVGSKVERVLQASSRVLIGLRHHQGIDEAGMRELEGALMELADEWVGRDCIPREAALILSEIEPGFGYAMAYYEREDPARADAMWPRIVEVSELAKSCIAGR